MSSILRKAMWPTALVAGMLMLLGAIGTATAPTAHAVAGDACAILGPFPSVSEDSADLDMLDGDADGDVEVDGIMLTNTEYLFAIYLEDNIPAAADPNAAPFMTVSIDDESGDADITQVASGLPAPPPWLLPAVAATTSMTCSATPWRSGSPRRRRSLPTSTRIGSPAR